MEKTRLVRTFRYGLLALILTIGTVAGGVAFPQVALAFAAGDGTESSPWQIADCSQLQSMNSWASDRDGHYLLVGDIDCSGEEFSRIAFGDGVSFRGSFDGKGYTVSNVAVTDFGSHNGFFSSIEGGIVKNLTLENISVAGTKVTGALAGNAEEAHIENVHIISGTVAGVADDNDYAIGGLVGRSDQNVYYQVSTNVTVSAPLNSHVGGLIGYSYDDIIDKAAADGSVTGGGAVGGLIGSSDRTELHWSHAKGDVIGEEQVDVTNGSAVGGLIGITYKTTMAEVYATGNVTATYDAGGLVGQMRDDTSVAYAYSSGAVTSEWGGGGLIGLVDGYPSTVAPTTFWDMQTSGFATSAGDGEVGKTTADMKQLSTYTDVGFDFNEGPYWGMSEDINDGYPCHAWESGCISSDEDGENGGDGGDSSLPNNGDGNNDGTLDSDQDNVVTVLSPVSKKYVTVAVDTSCELSDVSIADVSSHASQDSAYAYQSGFVHFTASGCDNDETNAQLYYHGVSPDGQIARKYNPHTNTYFTITSASLVALSSPLSGTLVSYTVIDNGELDIDDTEGVISDPVGLASNALGVPNTGLAHTSMVPFILAGVAGLGLILTFATPLRKKLYGLARS